MSEANEEMKYCQRCGGDSGYQYIRIERVTVTGSWRGNEEGQCEGLERETKPRCMDCGGIVKALRGEEVK